MWSIYKKKRPGADLCITYGLAALHRMQLCQVDVTNCANNMLDFRGWCIPCVIFGTFKIIFN